MVNIKAWNVQQRKAKGFGSMISYMKRKPGRPKKKRTSLTIDDVNIPTVAPQTTKQNKPTQQPVSKTPPKVTRTNWRVGENKVKMTKAINDWFQKTTPAVDCNGEEVTLKQFSVIVDIPYKTLVSYTKADATKRRRTGAMVGPKLTLSCAERKFMIDVLRRADRGNEGFDRREAIDTLQELMIDRGPPSREQCSKILSRHILNHPDSDGLLKKKIVVAQGTTTKRTAITFEQQWRWHTAVDAAYDQLRTRNTGMCKLTGKTFGELMGYFIIGGDEACFMANAHAGVRVIGSKDVRKQEKNIDDSRCSITAYRTGTVMGDQGPTAFLMKGEKIKRGFKKEELLTKFGAAPGSSVIMTETAFMTTEAWEKMTPVLVSGYRKINKYVAANPQWWCLEILDGFGAHFCSHYAMDERQKKKIMSLKEEGNSSHVNQAYDREVARNDKAHAAQSLAFLRKSRYATGHITNQWDLIFVVLGALRDTIRESWVRSFNSCNLNPQTRVSFVDWCEKIKNFLQKGDNFKTESAADKYLLLPGFWHGTTPEDKRKIFELIESEGGFTANCVQKLNSHEYSIRLVDMHHLRVCYEVAKENPEHLDRGIPKDDEIVNETAYATEVKAAKERATKVNDGLDSFMLKPDGMKGNALLDHMIRFRNRNANDSKPSGFLAIDISEAQASIINSSLKDLTQKSIIDCVGAKGARLKLVKRKLDNLGYMSGNCGMQNSNERLKRMKAQLELSESIAYVKRISSEEDESALEKVKEEMKTMAPGVAKNM